MNVEFFSQFRSRAVLKKLSLFLGLEKMSRRIVESWYEYSLWLLFVQLPHQMSESLPETYQYIRNELTPVRDLIALIFITRWYLGSSSGAMSGKLFHVWGQYKICLAMVSDYWIQVQLPAQSLRFFHINFKPGLILLYSCWFLKVLIYLVCLYIWNLLLWDDLDLSSPVLFNGC